MLVVARAAQRLGGALMVPVGRLVVLRATTRAEMIDAVAYLTWPALLAPVLAPLLGGWIVTVASWHWIFLVNLPLGVVAFVVGARVVPPSRAAVPPAGLGGSHHLRGVPVSLMIGIESVRPAGTGSGPLRPVGLLLAVVGFAVTGWWWLRRTPHPLLRFGASRVASFRVTNVGGSVYRMVISAVPFLLPFLFQVGFGWSAVRAGSYVLLLFAGNVLIKPATTPLLRRFGFRSVLIASIVGACWRWGRSRCCGRPPRRRWSRESSC